MIENALTRVNASAKKKIAVKSIVSAALVLCAVALPQLVHLIAGVAGGTQWLPMYLPVLVAGCLLGTYWGLGVGILSPVVSFFVTLAFGNPMPALARLPFMVAELAVIAAVCGAFSRKIAQDKWAAFAAVLTAFVVGRAVFVALVAIFGGVAGLSVAVIWSQIRDGAIALITQSLIVPLIVIGLGLLIKNRE